MKNKRKKKLINYSFQLKTAIPAIVISMVSFSIIISFVIFITSMSKNSSMLTTTQELDRSVKNEDEIVGSFKEYSKRIKDPIFILATDKIEADHDKNITVIKENIKILKAYSEKSNQLLAIAITVMALNSVVIFVFLIRATHKAAGPAQVMNRFVRDLLEGRKPELRSLRKTDEFKEFYEDFIHLAEKFQNKNKRAGALKTKAKSVPGTNSGIDEDTDHKIRIIKHE
jgi:hypothetical protein